MAEKIRGDDGNPHNIMEEFNIPKDVPLDGGNFFSDKKIMSKEPLISGISSSIYAIKTDTNDRQCDSQFEPNMFGRWGDIYGAFIGSYRLTNAPINLIRLEKIMMHLIFMQDKFSLLYNPIKKDFIIGTSIPTIVDSYGRILKGKFIPWNHIDNKNSDTEIIINKNKAKFIVEYKRTVWGIPFFMVIGFYVKMKNMLWRFKQINLRLSILQKIIGLKDQGYEIMKKFVDELFNMDSDTLPNPINFIDANIDEKTEEITFNFIDLDKNQISFSVSYMGNDINYDLTSLTNEIFRMAGIRCDMQSKSGIYNERSNSQQTTNAYAYFNFREEEMFKSFREFEYDLYEKLKISSKWISTFNNNQ